MIDQSTRDKVISRLLDVEQAHNVRVLLAVESGSRAWGFESPDSDYDVRFIYAHRRDWYETIDVESKRDVIECPIVDEMDISGWDVRKALKLYAGSNPSLVEWLQSPMVYINSSCFKREAKMLLDVIYSPTAGWYHYRHMATANTRNYLNGKEVPLKKYLYVIRALLASRYVVEHQTPPPLPINDLLYLIKSRDVRVKLEELINKKKQSGELGRGEAIPLLNEFIDAEFNDEPTFEPSKRNPDTMLLLNRVFKNVLRE